MMAVGSGDPLLSVSDLTIEFELSEGVLRAVDHVSFDVHSGEVLAIVGESGSGKSVTAKSLLGLLPSPPARVISGSAMFEGIDLLSLRERQFRHIRGGRIGMVFQDPLASLDPMAKVGKQIGEAIRAHQPRVSAREARMRVIELLSSVRVPDPAARYDEYPHQFSGGMAQRVLIAMAIANEPRLLIADEPTTALDVTVQAQVLRTLKTVQQGSGAGMILITHDLGLVAQTADRVAVMYSGNIVETGDVRSIFRRPAHPYTVGLLRGLPRVGLRRGRLQPIRGQLPRLGETPSGCVFQPRCDLQQARSVCVEERPLLVETSHGKASACHFRDQVDSLVVGHESSDNAPVEGGS